MISRSRGLASIALMSAVASLIGGVAIGAVTLHWVLIIPVFSATGPGAFFILVTTLSSIVCISSWVSSESKSSQRGRSDQPRLGESDNPVLASILAENRDKTGAEKTDKGEGGLESAELDAQPESQKVKTGVLFLGPIPIPLKGSMKSWMLFFSGLILALMFASFLL